MLSHVFLPLLAFTHLACALPTSTHTTSKRQDDSNSTSEYWTVPRLDMHMMSVHTGLPGDQWLPGTTFNSTIDFDVQLPNHTFALELNDTTTISPSAPLITMNCQTSFPNGTLPLGPIPCTSPSSTEVLFFEIYPFTDLGPRRPELAFWLDLTSAIGYDDEQRTAEVFWWGKRAVTANDPSEETSFLTCLEGAPFDGLRCKLRSYLSVDEELVVGVERLGGDGEEEGEGDHAGGKDRAVKISV